MTHKHHIFLKPIIRRMGGRTIMTLNLSPYNKKVQHTSINFLFTNFFIFLFLIVYKFLEVLLFL